MIHISIEYFTLYAISVQYIYTYFYSLQTSPYSHPILQLSIIKIIKQYKIVHIWSFSRSCRLTYFKLMKINKDLIVTQATLQSTYSKYNCVLNTTDIVQNQNLRYLYKHFIKYGAT